MLLQGWPAVREPVFRHRGVRYVGQTISGPELMKRFGNGRAVAVLLTSVLVAAPVLAFVVVQTRAATLQAPASTERRAYGDDVHTVRLGDTVDTEPGRFTARLPGRVAVLPLLPGCHSATPSAAPTPVPSPSPLPAPIPPGGRWRQISGR